MARENDALEGVQVVGDKVDLRAVKTARMLVSPMNKQLKGRGKINSTVRLTQPTTGKGFKENGWNPNVGVQQRRE